ncbi:uncharacterized protein B0H18DRAFT_1112645 [Fomitopsis serialis]|uniref:uncharacterized protein n=1 Tax=Fomitopsis serialis TaxID=139415 RepID=UPI002007D1F2|nr:uncharacterized protein B0H18DRAFT_1112645 [Neoantrodia serialis]KAH9938492.1 hypothetical protein B0H18DRAFT_1112645 [Neoantrodia serialis]
MFWLGIFRISVLAWTALCGIIVLALGGNSISVTQQYFNSYSSYAALGVATGVLAFVTLPIMIALDFFLNTFTSWIVVELSWLSILWVLFLATAARGQRLDRGIGGVRIPRLDSPYGLHDTLLVVAILNSGESTNIWKSSVKDAFEDTKSGNQYPMATNAHAEPVVQPQPQTV